VVIPCRDEQQTVGVCIKKIKNTFKKENINGEIIVVDNDSADNSAKIVSTLGAKVVLEKKIGYGAALLRGFSEAKGKYIVMGDADDTYDFSEFPKLIKKLQHGYDMVLGSRRKGIIKKGAMPWLRRYLGNPMLAFILNLFFKTKISDPQSGFRAFRRQILEKLNLKTTGMEFASEMLINASKKGLRIGEVPITYYPRKTRSKLKPVSDGWRHLRFMLMYSPTYLFLIPGMLLFFIGFFVLFASINYFSANTVIGALTAILGYQIINIGLYAKTYAIISGFEPHDKIIDFIAKHFPLEKTILIGLSVFITSIIIGFWAVKINRNNLPIVALTFLVLGLQTIFSGFFISMMLVEKKEI